MRESIDVHSALLNVQNDLGVIIQFVRVSDNLLLKKNNTLYYGMFSIKEQEYFNKVKRHDLINVLRRGMNTHDRASQELKDFLDVLEYGKPLQGGE